MALNLQALETHQLDAGAPIESAAPISPEDWGCSDGEGMQQETDLARFGRVPALPLTLLTQRTGATTADAGSIDQAQIPVGFWTPFL